MAASSVSISLHYATAPMLTQGTLLVNGRAEAVDVITTPTTSSQSTAAPSGLADHAYWRILPLGGAVHVAFGTDPTADTSDMQVAAGAEFYIRAFPGEKVAVIDA